MSGFLSFVKNLIFPPEDDLVEQEDEFDQKAADELLQRLHIEEQRSNLEQKSNDFNDIDTKLIDDNDDDDLDVQYSDIKQGLITAVKKDGGVINNVYICRSVDLLPHIIQIGDIVLFRKNEESMYVKVEKIIPRDRDEALDVIEPAQLIGKSFELDKKISGKITEKRVSSLIIDDTHTIDLNCAKYDLILEVGDFVTVECSADVHTGKVLDYKHVKPTSRLFLTRCEITYYNQDVGIGIVKTNTNKDTVIEVPFCKSVCKPGYLPALNDMVCIDAIKSDQVLFQWRAINLALTKRAEHQVDSSKTTTPDLGTHNGVSAKSVSGNKFIMNPMKSEYVRIEIRNGSSQYRKLEAVIIDNQSRNSGHLISQLRVLRPSHPHYTTLPCTIPANGSLNFTFEVLPKFYGRSSESVTLVLDEQVALKVAVELQVTLEGEDRNRKAGRRHPKKKSYTSEDIWFRDSLQDVIHGVRPQLSGMKFESVRLAPYDIPRPLVVCCQGTRIHPVSHSQMMINLRHKYDFLFQQMSGDNYLSKFHMCLFLEEIYLISQMANLDISKGVLKPSGEYLALYVVGLMESRPSLIIGDRVYASVPDNVNLKDKIGYEGYIHSIRNDELYIKFSQSFHDTYRGESYAFRFFHSRTQFRRLHHVLDEMAKPRLGIDWLFPHTVQERVPVVALVNEEEETPPPEYLSPKPELMKEKLRRIFPAAHQDDVNENGNVLDISMKIDSNEKGNYSEESSGQKVFKSIDINANTKTENDTNSMSDTKPASHTANVNKIENTTLNKELDFYNKILNAENGLHCPKIISPSKYGLATSDQTLTKAEEIDFNETNGEKTVNVNDEIASLSDRKLCSDKSNGEKIDISDNPCRILPEETSDTEDKSDEALLTAIADSLPKACTTPAPDNEVKKRPRKCKVSAQQNWGKTKRDSTVNWVRDFGGMGGNKRATSNSSLTTIPMRDKELKWFNKDLNWYQKAAVRNILEFKARPLPYIIFGPPGTGKTVTVTETILQLYTLIPEARIILATPNNSSADLLTEKLIESGQFQIGELARLLSFTYLQSGLVPADIAPYSCTLSNKHLDDYSATVDNSGGVTSQSRESLLKHRLLISTCSSFGQLLSVGTPPGYFTHCIVDEAGQATEPEVLIPISLLHKDNGHVVLAGDPLQLGPCVLSKLGQQLELATSLLERLTYSSLYSRDLTRYFQTGGYDPRLVTRLVDNYRTMPEILKIASDLFYDSSLVPHVTLDDYEGLILRKLSKILPARSCLPYPSPILFYGVQGDNMQDSDSPSWYNSTEAVVVVSYLRKLYEVGMTPDQIGIITPYKKQVFKIRSVISGINISQPKVGSIEEFQGQERLVIILSTVRSSAASNFLPRDIEQCLGFIGLPTRLNVAITRARALLVIVGDPNLLCEDLHWQKIITYAQSIGGYTGIIPSNPKLN